MKGKIRLMYENHINPAVSIYSVGVIFIFVISILLLFLGLLDGAEFVAFVIASAVLAIIIKMMPEISEFSLAGNSVKLKEKLGEADRLTNELKALKLSTLRTLFQLIIRPPGGFASSYSDGRLPEFFNFFNEVKDTEYESEFAEKLLEHSLVFQKKLERHQADYLDKQASGNHIREDDEKGIKKVRADLVTLGEMISNLKKTFDQQP